jgi:hypothetical protein
VRKIGLGIVLFVCLVVKSCNNPFRPPAPPTPVSPKLVSPENGDTMRPGKVTLLWVYLTPHEVVSYHLQVSKNSSFDHCIIDKKLKESRLSANFSEVGVQYFWRVKVMTKKFGAWSNWSEVWKFTVSLAANNPPDVPSEPSPEHKSTGVSLVPLLNWKSGDPDGDTVTYIIYFGKDSTFTSPLDSIIDKSGGYPVYSSYDKLDTLDSLTVYYWKIVAKDHLGKASYGPVWEFTTGGGGNEPPNKPNISTPSPDSIWIDEVSTFTAQASDPEGDSVRYQFDFGDGSSSDWTSFVPSGEAGSGSHIYKKLGTFHVKARAQDKHGNTSGWSDSLQIEVKIGRGVCWIADHDSLAVIVKAGRRGSIIDVFNIRGWPVTLAVDTIDGCVWIACTYDNSIVKISPTGDEKVYKHGDALPPGPIPHGKSPSTPCIDYRDNRHCWFVLAEVYLIVKFHKDTGEPLQIISDSSAWEDPDHRRHQLPAIALDNERNWMWIAETDYADVSNSYIARYNFSAREFDLRIQGVQATYIEVDPKTHYCWGVEPIEQRVFKVSPEGVLTRLGLRVTNPFSLSVDSERGCVWIGCSRDGEEVIKISTEGEELFRRGVESPVTGIEVDPISGDCWASLVSKLCAVKLSKDSLNIICTVNSNIFRGPSGIAVNPNFEP